MILGTMMDVDGRVAPRELERTVKLATHVVNAVILLNSLFNINVTVYDPSEEFAIFMLWDNIVTSLLGKSVEIMYSRW
ncbi:hypothetical protein OROGR_028394 [Orobanche gracilis]